MRASRARTLAAVLLALAVPGLGHVALGRRKRGAAFFLIVATAFGLGLLLGGGLDAFDVEHPLTFLSAAATHALGLLSVVARVLGLGVADLGAATHEYGRAYVLSAATMNVLLVLDVLEIAEGEKP